MVQSKAKTVAEYLAGLPAPRRAAIAAVRKVILENLDGYEETMQYGMIAYVIPLDKYSKTYNSRPLAIAGLASQKNYMALYLMNVYSSKKMQQWFVKEYKASGKELDMGKSCVRFKKLDSLPLELVGKTIAKTRARDFIKQYETRRNKTH